MTKLLGANMNEKVGRQRSYIWRVLDANLVLKTGEFWTVNSTLREDLWDGCLGRYWVLIQMDMRDYDKFIG